VDGFALTTLSQSQPCVAACRRPTFGGSRIGHIYYRVVYYVVGDVRG
jgi:hypothetical protein